jgi:hypothetical protein
VWTVVQGTTTCQRAQANGSSRPVQVPITVTTPAAATATSSVPPPPYPVCVLINGFQVTGPPWDQSGATETLKSPVDMICSVQHLCCKPVCCCITCMSPALCISRGVCWATELVPVCSPALLEPMHSHISC